MADRTANSRSNFPLVRPGVRRDGGPREFAADPDIGEGYLDCGARHEQSAFGDIGTDRQGHALGSHRDVECVQAGEADGGPLGILVVVRHHRNEVERDAFQRPLHAPKEDDGMAAFRPASILDGHDLDQLHDNSLWQRADKVVPVVNTVCTDTGQITAIGQPERW